MSGPPVALTVFLAVFAAFITLSFTEVLLEPVPLHDVELHHDSRYDRAVSLNRDYILELDNDRLLHSFR